MFRLILILCITLASCTRVPETLTVELNEEVSMDFVYIPPGSFLMGAAPGEEGPLDQSEEPQHRVEVSRGFYLAKYELTQSQWRAIVGTQPWRRRQYVKEGAQYPATYIAWLEVEDFIRRLNDKAGRELYRLPSEAEWEYAARAGSGTARFWGNNSEKACKFANVFDKTGAASGEFLTMMPHRCDDGYKQTSPVGSYMANAFGLHDTAGNAWEWNEDCWHKSYSGAPIDNRAWTASGRCNQRIVRGGSWISIARYVRSGNRSKINKDSRIYRNGFRVALTLGR